MFLLFIISLSIIFYFICMELVKPVPPESVLSGPCPGCSEQAESGWLVCPSCQTVLRKSCYGCGKAHDVWMKYCPWCKYLNETISV